MNKTTNAKHYFAFISHSTIDQTMAFWLRDKLEKYKIPTSVQDEVYVEFKGVKRIKPCFAYQTDLAGGDLNKALNKELSDSQYLIVVCSPEAAKSDYVNKEVRHFIETGRAEKIIPFIIKGIPKESFPPALIDLSEGKFFDNETQHYRTIDRIELRGVDYQQLKKDLHSKMAPVVNVIATMLGVRFDSLWDRFRRRRRMRNISIWIAAAFLLFASLFFWNRYTPEFVYYADFVECKGVPQGLCPISNEQQKEREMTYRFRYDYLSLFEKKRYLTRVDCISSHGNPVLFDSHHINIQGMLKDLYPIVLLNYDVEKQVKSVTLCDVHGNPQIDYLYSSINLKGERAFVADIIYRNNNYDKNDFINMEERLNKTKIKRILYKIDEEGYIRSITYHANNGNLKESITMNDHGVYGYDFVLDSSNRLLSIVSINEEKHRMNDIDGVNRIMLEYDDMSNVVSKTHFDKNDKPVNCSWNYCKCINEFDQYGNCVKGITYDENGQICISKQGYAIEQHLFLGGCVIESTCFDENGNKINNTDKVWKAMYEYDSRGNCIKMSCFDTEDEYTNNKDGWSISELKYDNDNNCIERQTFNKEYLPVISKEKGEARIVVKYDKFGRQVEGTSYGVNGEKTINNYGYCIEKRVYGKVGNVSLWECFDTEGKRVCCKDGYAIMRSEVLVDEFGNQIIVFSFFDNNENAVMSNDFKSHKCEFTLDQNGNLIEQRFYDIENKLFVNKDGVAVMRFSYDSKSRKILDEFYDENETLTNSVPGIAIIETVYLNDTTTVICYKDNNGRLCMSAGGASIAEIVQAGDTVIRYSYDTLHILCINRDGYAISKEVFDKQKRPIAGFYYDTAGNSTKRFDSIAGFRYNYDNRGNVLEEVFLGTNQKPANCLSGFAITLSKYDDRDNRIEVSIYDQDYNPTMGQSLFYAHKLVMTYDDQDRLVEGCTYDDNDEIYYDPNNGFACVRHQYDMRGNVIETRYLDEDLDPTTNLYGIYKEKKAYDSKNNLILKKTYDEYDNLTPGSDGQTAICEQKWNERNVMIQTDYYDADSSWLGVDIFEYNQYGFPLKVKRQVSGSSNSIEMILTPFAYVISSNASEMEQYLILEWENWNITKQTDYYIDALLKSRTYKKKRMFIMTSYGQIKEVVLDENDIVEQGKLLEQDYQTYCKQYLQWKKN